ncbi:MAG: glycosyltransferase [Flavobacterium sp.]|nr:glycosyltransferase [Flavobacterium sp.]
MFSLNEDQIIVAPPQLTKIPQKYLHQQQIETTDIKTFFFPTFPRPFKNIEVIGEAVKLLNKDGFYNFKVIITIDGTENRYAKTILKRYSLENNIDFIGLIKREAVYEFYSKIDCLIFPSKLETWGLPISEFKQFNKPIFVSDLPYAHENVGNYDKVVYFDPSNASQLAKFMQDFILSNYVPNNCKQAINNSTLPHAANWEQLFSILFNGDKSI